MGTHFVSTKSTKDDEYFRAEQFDAVCHSLYDYQLSVGTSDNDRVLYIVAAINPSMSVCVGSTRLYCMVLLAQKSKPYGGYDECLLNTTRLPNARQPMSPKRHRTANEFLKNSSQVLLAQTARRGIVCILRLHCATCENKRRSGQQIKPFVVCKRGACRNWRNRGTVLEYKSEHSGQNRHSDPSCIQNRLRG